MFVDALCLRIVAGFGGNGTIAWRREKYIPKGGPYGGNGGRGGAIIFEGDCSLFSLDLYRNRRLIRGENGQSGGSNLKQGRSGRDLILKLPYGTIVKDSKTKEVLFDCTEKTPKWTACKGGRGGRGNASFKSATNQAPNFCTPGTSGDVRDVELELKLIADVGLVGMPNAGKSTLLSALSSIQVKTAPYPFTTLVPNLSYIEHDDYTRTFIADIPGIIEKAHENRGLGLTFLKHIERTSMLIFVVDISGEEGRDPYSDFLILRKELEAYQPQLLEKPCLVALNKCDKENAEENIEAFRSLYPFSLKTLFPISALKKQGLLSFTKEIRQLARA